MKEHREIIETARRVVVKVGSRVLVRSGGRPDLRRIRSLVRAVTGLHRDGREVVIVSSGAVSAGMQALRMKSRPSDLPDLQMAAAVGQTRLMAHYEKYFSEQRLRVGQVLLTHDDLNHRRRHLNARNTILNLLRNGIVPIVNENDVVSVDEIKFGDNDMLAALVTHLIQADLLILLTTSNGVREPTSSGRTRRVSHIEKITPKNFSWVADKKNPFSIGGMWSKLEAAQTAAQTGSVVVIADGRKESTLQDLMSGKDIGTLIAGPGRTLSGRKRWIAFFHKPQGSILVDAGACEAIEKKGKSLLAIGVREVEGSFKTGDVVRVSALDGREIARGLVDYTSGDLQKIKGHKTGEIRAILGSRDYKEVIHRDNMVLLGDEGDNA